MGGTLDVMRARISACYGVNLIQKSEDDELEKGGAGSGRKASSLAKHKLLVDAHEQAKGIHENFRKNPPTDYQGKMNHKDAENRAADSRKALREHIEKHYEEHKELLDSKDHTLNQKMHDKFKKSEDENEIEKGRKASVFGSQSKDGKYIKTTQGWKRVEVHQANGGKLDEKPAGSSSFGSFDKMDVKQLNKFLSLANDAKQKNLTGATLTSDEQYALDHNSDIVSALSKLK